MYDFGIAADNLAASLSESEVGALQTRPAGSFEKKHPLAYTLLKYLVVLLVLAGGRLIFFYAIDQHDVAKYTQFKLDNAMIDSGEYFTPEDLKRPYQDEDYYGKRILLTATLGTPEESKGFFWYADAEFPDTKNSLFKLYSEEELPAGMQNRMVQVDCLVTGSYSIPTGEPIQVAISGYLCRIVNVTETELSG